MKQIDAHYIDVHCHLDSYDDTFIAGAIRRAREKGVGIIVNNGVNPATNRRILDLAGKYPEIKAALGVYPIEALTMSEKDLNKELEYIIAHAEEIVAIGEVGMDFKEDEVHHALQERNFRLFVQLAKELDVPVIVHSRKAESEVVRILKEEKASKVVMHCFSGSMKLVDECIAQGWSLSIPTNVTFSEHFQMVVKRAPLHLLLCETDSPYLHPVKGSQNNEPVNVTFGYTTIANLRGISEKEVIETIGNNYLRLFEK